MNYMLLYVDDRVEMMNDDRIVAITDNYSLLKTIN